MSETKHLVIINPNQQIVKKLQLTLVDGNYVQTLPNQICADIALRNFKNEVKLLVGNVEFQHAIV